MDRKNAKELIENKLIHFQEEATTKWSSDDERRVATKLYDEFSKLKTELGLDDESDR